MQALLAEGLKTQSALADRIAEVENLDTSPKDLVNRVFRELPVDPSTLERIAAVLKVPAHTLYLSSDEESQRSPAHATDAATETAKSSDQTTSESNQHPAEPNLNQDSLLRGATGDLPPTKTNRKRTAISVAATLAIIASISLIWFGVISPPPASGPDNPKAMKLPQSLVIYPEGSSLKATTEAFAKLLPEDIKHNIVAKPLINPPINAANIADQFQADGVITLRLISQGRYQFTQIYFYHQSEEQLVAAIHHTKDDLRHHPEQLARLYRDAIQPVLEGRAKAVTLSLADQKSFLQARTEFDFNNSELHIKRGQSLLINLLKRHPGMALADAGLCESYVMESAIGNEKLLLDQATDHCNQAIASDPNNPYAQQALGFLFHRTGRLDQAITTYQKALESWPNSGDILRRLAWAQMLDFDKDNDIPDQEKFDQALLSAEKATLLAPELYSSFELLGAFYYESQRYPEMIEALQKALEIQDNPTAKLNLSVAYLCNGQPEKLYDLLEEPSGGENTKSNNKLLGRFYFYTGDFDQSVKYRKRTVYNVGNGEGAVSSKWGYLADSQRHAGDNAGAIESYRTAITIVTRDNLRGNTFTNKQVFYAYYYQMLNRLDPESYPAEDAPYSLSELEEHLNKNVDTSVFYRLALIFQSMGEPTLAHRAANEAIERCPGYKLHPDYPLLTD